MLMRASPSVTRESTGVEIAAAVLEDLKSPERWCKNALQDDQGARCLAGSAFFVTKGNDRDVTFEDLPVIARLATAMGFPNWQEMVVFNNASTHAEVVARLQAAL